MFKNRLMYQTALAAVLSTTLAVQPLMLAKALADGGDFSLDFTAAAPLTYNHATGGGAYNDRTVGRDKDIVESLEGGDFACGDLVSFLTQITVGSGAPQQTIELLYEFTAHSTGQQGVALGDIVNVQINYGVGDIGINDDLGSTAILVSEQILTQPVFTKGSVLEGKIQVTDLEANETVVLRTDVRIFCNGQSATGNMQARLAGGAVVSPLGEAGTINVGDQTVPFKRVGDICKDCEPPK
jgi:hypothetical protein